MADETTVQLPKDLHKRIRFLAVQRDTSVKLEIQNAVTQYLQQAQAGTVPQVEQSAQAPA